MSKVVEMKVKETNDMINFISWLITENVKDKIKLCGNPTKIVKLEGKQVKTA